MALTLSDHTLSTVLLSAIFTGFHSRIGRDCPRCHRCSGFSTGIGIARPAKGASGRVWPGS
jgi:hypothetical protein